MKTNVTMTMKNITRIKSIEEFKRVGIHLLISILATCFGADFRPHCIPGLRLCSLLSQGEKVKRAYVHECLHRVALK